MSIRFRMKIPKDKKLLIEMDLTNAANTDSVGTMVINGVEIKKRDRHQYPDDYIRYNRNYSPWPYKAIRLIQLITGYEKPFDFLNLGFDWSSIFGHRIFIYGEPFSSPINSSGNNLSSEQEVAFHSWLKSMEAVFYENNFKGKRTE